MYVHFTSERDAEAIVASLQLWGCSYLDVLDEETWEVDETKAHGYAVAVGGVYVPEVQRTVCGRVSERNAAVLFTTDQEPKWVNPEEVVWEVPVVGGLVLTEAVIVPLEDAVAALDGSANIPDPMD